MILPWQRGGKAGHGRNFGKTQSFKALGFSFSPETFIQSYINIHWFMLNITYF